MELIDQHTKRVMEGCKERAAAAGLHFTSESLEYIVTNRDLVELSPKVMIPTLYDYWVHDVEVLKERGKYELYPGNPYETVINTRPPISFYNDNNPDWLNVMIFYHVLAHIDFFQNNLYFRRTWDYDFTGQALSDKRLIAKLRSAHGRWVDYVIEFARSVDNLVGYFDRLANGPERERPKLNRLDYYFDVFLQDEKKATQSEYMKELEAYNQACREHGSLGERVFFEEVKKKHPEFEAHLEKRQKEPPRPRLDVMQHVLEHSDFLNASENRWMKSVLEVVRNTSLFLQPQIRTKIMNEGWASYWHQELFLKDDRIAGNEVNYARVNSYVTSLPRVGLNPYALGMRLFQFMEEEAGAGRLSHEFERERDAEKRKEFHRGGGDGREFIFKVREDCCDFTFINRFVTQDFMTRHKLFVSGKRLNRQKGVWEYYVKSRRVEDYKAMLMEALYHPPRVDIRNGPEDGRLRLNHVFEGKPLVAEFIEAVLMGLEYLWGATVELETSELAPADEEPEILTGPGQLAAAFVPELAPEPELKWRRVRYTMAKRELAKEVLEQS